MPEIVSHISWLDKDYLEKSKKEHESKFIRFINTNFKDILFAYESTQKADMKQHIDGYIKSYTKNKVRSYDFKQIKKIKRSGDYNDNVMWVELDNGYGNGWLNGEEDFIVQDRLDEYLLIPRKALLRFITKKVMTDAEVHPIPYSESDVKFYRKYSRSSGRNDVIILASIEDIKANCKTKAIPKDPAKLKELKKTF